MKVAAKDAKKFAVLDVEFHIALAQSSGNTLVFDLVSMIRSHLVRALPRVLLLPNAMPLSAQEHVVIIDAIERHDADAARHAMHAHLEAVVRRYFDADGKGGSARGKATNGKVETGRARHTPKR
jgi:GntR family transcriptional repressor for pyruvate dehydrogenase complex